MNTNEELQAICESYESTESLAQDLARKNDNAFIEYVFKDEKGRKVIQGRIHEEIQWHINECEERGIKNCGILAPWGHGKTEQIIAKTLKKIGENVNIRTQIICNTDDNATARVQSAKKYIEDDEDYHKVFPHVRPTKNEWGKHKIVVHRDSKAKDGTLESWGIASAGTGSRADLQIFDDPVDLNNAILNPAKRQHVKDAFYNVWASRLVADGFRIYIATVWHEDDLTHELLASKEWKFLVMKVSEDFKTIRCKSPFKGEYEIPVWELWNEKRLKEQIRTIGVRAFNRGYRQEALSDEDRTFPSSDKIFNWDLSVSDVVQSHFPRILGCDPFGQAVVISVWALAQSGRRILVEKRRGKWAPERTIAELLDAYEVHQPSIMVVENNAAQEAIIGWFKAVSQVIPPVMPFVTGKQKADPELGLPGMEIEFANDMWLVPCKGVDPLDSEHPINVFKKELRSHPIGEAADTVMAAWFAREGARYLMKLKTEPQEQETYTEEDFGVEQVQIGDY